MIQQEATLHLRSNHLLVHLLIEIKSAACSLFFQHLYISFLNCHGTIKDSDFVLKKTKNIGTSK